MEEEKDILFGKIARELGLVSKEDIQECVRIQEQLKESRPLGKILIDRGYIAPEQVDEIVEKQKENLRQKGKITRKIKRENLYGKLALRFDFATKDQINEAVRVQANFKEREEKVMPLGRILKSRGYITPEEHDIILNFQENNLLPCPSCGKEYNVVMYNPGASIPCYACDDGQITVPPLPDKLLNEETN